MDAEVIALLREILTRDIADAAGRVYERLTEIDAAIGVLRDENALLRARLEALETPAETEVAEEVEAIAEGEAPAEDASEAAQEQLVNAVEAAEEIEADIEAVEDEIAPASGHVLTRRIIGGSE